MVIAPNMRWVKRSFLLAVLALVSSSVACSSSEDKTPVTPEVSPDAASDAAPEPELESLTLYMLVGSRKAALPFAGGTVVFDKPGGERVERSIGPDGLVTITDIDWSKGKAALSAFGPGANVESFVEFDKETLRDRKSTEAPVGAATAHDLMWIMSPSVGPKLKGTLSHAQGSYVTATSTRGMSMYQGSSSSYELTLLPNDPSSIVFLDWSDPSPATVSSRGIEQVFHRWLRFDQAPIAGDETRDFDLDTGAVLPTTKVNAKIAIPGGANGPLGGSSTGYVQVSSETSNPASLFIGAATKADVSADGESFELTIEYANIEGGSPVTQYMILLADGAQTFLALPGLPTEGFVASDMLAPPVVIEAKRSLSEPFALDGLPDDAPSRLLLADARGRSWNIDVPQGIKSVHLPALEGALGDAVGKLSTGRIAAFADPDPEQQMFRRAVVSRSFKVVK